MCGITGIIDPDRLLRERLIDPLTATLIHRGPDMGGTYHDDYLPISLGHRRLSILDLSEHGKQPMTSPSSRYVITFNGEIYNFDDVRKELLKLGHTFRGNSDTEVITHAFDQWGIEASVPRFSGMFAIGVIDREQATLTLIRDRLGEKPLYYGRIGTSLLFASEMQAFSQHPQWQLDIDRSALAAYCRYGYVPAPQSIAKGIHKLPPGCLLTISLQGQTSDLKPRRYWDIARIAAEKAGLRAMAKPFEHYRDASEQLLIDAVRKQMVADVPLGAFLSSGIDSTIVTAIMQSISSQPINTFTIGFKEKEFNEAPYAQDISRHLGTQHTEVYVSAADALELVPQMATIYDEPFADSSQLPTRLLCSMARRHVTVCLTGDGGDELFCGYNRYVLGRQLAGINQNIPHMLRSVAAKPMSRIPPQFLANSLDIAGKFVPALRNINKANVQQKLSKLIEGLDCRDDTALYQMLLSYWQNPDTLVTSGREPDFTFRNERAALGQESCLSGFMLWDQLLYLPDDNLAKVDRASMSVSLETRLPLLTPELVEYSWEIPRDTLLHKNQSKAILREILDKYVPRHLMERPKMGFSVPIAHWLRGELKDWAHTLLFDPVMREFFSLPLIDQAWQEHQSGKRDHAMRLWTLLMFGSWYQQQKGHS